MEFPQELKKSYERATGMSMFRIQFFTARGTDTMAEIDVAVVGRSQGSANG
jgi:hypothetical protein